SARRAALDYSRSRPPVALTVRDRSRLVVTDLGAAAIDVFIERLGDGRIERRLFVFGQRSFPDPGGALGGIVAARDLPALVVLPIRDQWLVEGVLVPLDGMRLAEEV